MENIEVRPSKDGKNVTYRVCLSVMINGRIVKHTRSFSSKEYGGKKMALEIAKDYRDKMRADFTPARLTVCTLDDLMALKEKTLTHSVATNTAQRNFYNNYIRPYVGNIDIKDVTASDIQLTLNNLVATKQQDTINRLLTLWKQLYKTAIIHDLADKDLTYKVITPKSDMIQTKKDTTTTVAELEEICETLYKKMNSKRTAILISHALHIMFYTGLRPQEVYALTRSDIDPNRRTIRINKSVGSNSQDTGVIVNAKTPQSVRTLYYPTHLDAVFSDLLNNQGELLFETNKGVLTGRYVSITISRLRPAGCKFNQYDLRHQFATDLIANGTDVKTVQSLMGHASAVMSLGYAQSTKEAMKEAINSRPLPHLLPHETTKARKYGR